jgi:signal transduction histidine kinase
LCFQTSRWLLTFWYLWTQAFAVALIILVLERALHTRTSFPRIGRVLQTGAYTCLAMPLTRELGLYSQVGGPALQMLLLIGILSTCWISIVQWRRHIRGAGTMLIAHIVLIVPLIIMRGVYMGLVPANVLTGATWIPTLLVFLFLAQTSVFVGARAGRRDREAIHNEIQTARKIALNEQQLREEQSLFFSFVAHELRSPLGVIVLGLKNLSRELVGLGDPARERLIRVNRAADRMGALIENHLTLQRLKSGHFHPQTASVHPQLAAEEALEQVRANFPHRRFILQGGAFLSMWVEMDVELTVLALSNLLINAAKYSPDDSPVVLDISLDSLLHYRVMDKGPGISAKDQEKIFAPYNRASMADNARGFGIGLSIAQNVAATHGGTLQYADRPEGGSMFTLSIPLTAPTPVNAA